MKLFFFSSCLSVVSLAQSQTVFHLQTVETEVSGKSFNNANIHSGWSGLLRPPGFHPASQRLVFLFCCCLLQCFVLLLSSIQDCLQSISAHQITCRYNETLSSFSHTNAFFFLLRLVCASCLCFFFPSYSVELRLNQLYTQYTQVHTRRHNIQTCTKAELLNFAHKDAHTPKEGAVPPGATSVTC